MKYIKLHIMFLGLCLSMTMVGQHLINVPCSFSFEDTEDFSNWTLNEGSAAACDRWVVGSATHSDGYKSLYINTDSVSDPYFGNKPNIVVAYQTIKFPTSSKTEHYDLSFDWKCVGDTGNAMMYVLIVPYAYIHDPSSAFHINKIASSSNGKLSKSVIGQCSRFEGGMNYLSGSEVWRSVSLASSINVSANNSKQTFVLMFIWANANQDRNRCSVGACVDNIQFASANVKKPTQLTIEPYCEDSSMMVCWESPLEMFTVEYKKTGSAYWRRIDGIVPGVEGYTEQGVEKCFKLNNIEEATYDVRVQGVLNNDISAYTVSNQNLYYCPDNHCINYLNLDNPNLVCTYGFRDDYRQGTTPYDSIGYINFGSDSKDSRHTIHLDPRETDPRTGNKLKCVPDGALGAVRLGNWNADGEAESMTYAFTVDSAQQGILLIKYAVVLEEPGTSCGDPGFKMVVLDSLGNEVDEICGKADFGYSDAAAAGWNMYEEEGAYAKVAWKDWTSVGLNLQRYNNQTLYVRLTTNDCGAGGHYGYAYFTIDCISAYIHTENCGTDAKVICDAPEGFQYRWYDETGTTLGHDQTLEADAGRHTYTCRVSYLEDTTCYFELSTLSAPRFPVPEYTYKWNPENCANYIRFTNTSHVMNKFEGYEQHTGEACTDFLWYFTRIVNGMPQTPTTTSNPSPVYTCRAEGDTLVVQFTSYIGENNACDSTRIDTLIIPSILPPDTMRMVEGICEGTGFFFDEQWRTESGIYVSKADNFAGCDSLSTLYLSVNPAGPDTTIVQMICSDTCVTVGNNCYSATNNYTAWLKNRWGCDSIVQLHLTVEPKIENASFVNAYPLVACADDDNLDIYFQYNHQQATFDSIKIAFDNPYTGIGFGDTTLYALDKVDPYTNSMHISLPYPNKVTPNYDTLTLTTYQTCCGTQTFKLPVQMNYASSIVEQKWNDVLAVLNERFNGGYQFIAYQWYKNGMPIEGEVGSYLYQPLDTTAIYYVELTRMDGVRMYSCPMMPTLHTDQQEFPTLVNAAQKIPVRIQKTTDIQIFTSVGQLYAEYKGLLGNVQIQAPRVKGVYLVHMVFEDGTYQAQQMIVK